MIMESDTEISFNSNIISNYNICSKKREKKSKVFKDIKLMVKGYIIIFYITIIIIIIFINKKNNLSKIIKRQQQQLNKTNNLSKIIKRQHQ